jgi:[ribosomal protein S5]-alanine N-acetyltransferase
MNDVIPINTLLATKRLLLRYPELTDAAQIYAVVKSPQFPDQLPLKELSSEAEIKDWLRGLQEGWVAAEVFSWIIEDRAFGRMVGQITLSKLQENNLWGLAFWAHPDHWGKGYATEAAERILAFGFKVMGAKKIWAGAGEWNKGSRRVLEKIGMEYVGDDPQGYYSKGQPINTRGYEISLESWQNKQTEMG